MFFLFRIAFWILLSDCLLAWCLPINDFGANDLKNIKCESDSTFYAPINVEKACITTALDCVMRVFIGTVKAECEDPDQRAEYAADYLSIRIDELKEKGHAQSDDNECACERWPQESYSGFLERVNSLLQITYSLR